MWIAVASFSSPPSRSGAHCQWCRKPHAHLWPQGPQFPLQGVVLSWLCLVNWLTFQDHQKLSSPINFNLGLRACRSLFPIYHLQHFPSTWPWCLLPESRNMQLGKHWPNFKVSQLLTAGWWLSAQPVICLPSVVQTRLWHMISRSEGVS